MADKTESSPPLPALSAAYCEDGVDLTLIRWMLSLTPAERLEMLEASVRSLLRLRGEETET